MYLFIFLLMLALCLFFSDRHMHESTEPLLVPRVPQWQGMLPSSGAVRAGALSAHPLMQIGGLRRLF